MSTVGVLFVSIILLWFLGNTLLHGFMRGLGQGLRGAAPNDQSTPEMQTSVDPVAATAALPTHKSKRLGQKLAIGAAALVVFAWGWIWHGRNTDSHFSASGTWVSTSRPERYSDTGGVDCKKNEMCTVDIVDGVPSQSGVPEVREYDYVIIRWDSEQIVAESGGRTGFSNTRDVEALTLTCRTDQLVIDLRDQSVQCKNFSLRYELSPEQLKYCTSGLDTSGGPFVYALQ